MKRRLSVRTKDFSEIMDSIDLDNIKPNPTIAEVAQKELQETMDYIMQHEIPCILELLGNAENEKELKFYQEKMSTAQKRFVTCE